MESKDYKFCPSCHLINPEAERVCIHCGKPFGYASGEYLTSGRVEMETKFFPEGLKEKIEKMNKEAPADGIAIYVPDQSQSIGICLEDVFIIGRSDDGTEDKFVDLSPYNAFDLGVSRRHLMIRRDGRACNVIDLKSMNGTWVNEQGLVPQRPTPVKSGSQLRLGKMRIFLVFRQ